MSNEEVSIDWKCISSGGSQFSDGEFVMSGTLGQTAVGDANDGETGVRLGYWQILTPETACGDVNMSGYIDIDDIIYLIAYIFTGGPPPEPLEVGDLNCIEDVDVDDVMYLISYVFLGGAYPCDPNDDGIPDC